MNMNDFKNSIFWTYLGFEMIVIYFDKVQYQNHS